MTLRITTCGDDSAAMLTLDGRLTGEEIPELRRAVKEMGEKVILDMTGLQSADRQGVTVLREFRAQGAQLIGVSNYLALVLGEAPREGS